MSTSSPASTSTSTTTTTTRPNDFFDLSEEAKADDQYVVEKIIARRHSRKGKWEYLLKWAGFSDEDNTWEAQKDIHPDLVAEFDRTHVEIDATNPIYSTLGDDLPLKARLSTSSIRTDTPPAKKKKKITSSSISINSSHEKSSTSTSTPTETRKKLYGVEKGWRVRAVIGAAKQKDSSVLYAVDYVQGSPLLREYVPSEIAHVYIPRELIEFFQKKIVWNSSNENKKSA